MTLDQQVLLELKADKQKGFKLLFKRYYRPMCVYGSKYVSELHIVEDLVQDILLHIWDREDYSSMYSLRNYLFTSIRNKCINHLKKRTIHLEDIEYDWQTDLFIQEDDHEEIQKKIIAVKQAIEELPPGCERIFKAVVISGMKYQEAADELDISINTVKSQMRKAYKMLSTRMKMMVFLVLMWKRLQRKKFLNTKTRGDEKRCNILMIYKKLINHNAMQSRSS